MAEQADSGTKGGSTEKEEKQTNPGRTSTGETQAEFQQRRKKFQPRRLPRNMRESRTYYQDKFYPGNNQYHAHQSQQQQWFNRRRGTGSASSGGGSFSGPATTTQQQPQQQRGPPQQQHQQQARPYIPQQRRVQQHGSNSSYREAMRASNSSSTAAGGTDGQLRNRQVDSLRMSESSAGGGGDAGVAAGGKPRSSSSGAVGRVKGSCGSNVSNGDGAPHYYNEYADSRMLAAATRWLYQGVSLMSVPLNAHTFGSSDPNSPTDCTKLRLPSGSDSHRRAVSWDRRLERGITDDEGKGRCSIRKFIGRHGIDPGFWRSALCPLHLHAC